MPPILSVIAERSRQWFDIGSAQNFRTVAILGGSQNAAIVDIELRRQIQLGLRTEIARIGDHTLERGRGTGFRRSEIDIGILGAGAAFEIAVERADGFGTGSRSLAHADAGTAGRFENARAGLDDLRERAGIGDHRVDLLGAGRDGQVELREDLLAVKDCRGDFKIIKRRVRAGTDADLLGLGAGDLSNWNDVVGRMRLGNQRFELVRDRFQ